METDIQMEQMRSQLAALKEQLANQTIVNDKLIRKATADKASKVKSKKNSTLLIGLVALAAAVPIFIVFGFPLYFVIYTAAMIIFSMVMTIVYHRNVEKADFFGGDLKSAALEYKELRRKYNQWYWIAIPMLIVFLALLCVSLNGMEGDQLLKRSYIIGALIGGTIGALMGVSRNRDLVRLCNEIIRDIEGLA